MCMYRRPNSMYPKNWNSLRFYIFTRDDYTCQLCGRKTKYPQCHHIDRIKISHNSHPNNLITICKSCHMKEHNIK